jgi:hypothetical protein
MKHYRAPLVGGLNPSLFDDADYTPIHLYSIVNNT